MTIVPGSFTLSVVCMTTDAMPSCSIVLTVGIIAMAWLCRGDDAGR
jgi:hypothetical protein